MDTSIKRVKKNILNMSYWCDAGHIPSALSHVDFLHYMFTEPDMIDLKNDYVVVGKPYGAQAYYAIFAEMGIIDEKDLFTFGKTDSNLTHGITDKVPHIMFAEDTLGSAVGIGCGLSISLLNRRVPDVVEPWVWINISDAVLQAGTIWEGIMFAGAKKLKNIVMTVDYNNMQCTGAIDTIVPVEPLRRKFKDFGWDCISAGGHDKYMIGSNFHSLFTEYAGSDNPKVIIFHTMKGKGIDFMECKPEWHYRCVDERELLKCLRQVERS